MDKEFLKDVYVVFMYILSCVFIGKSLLYGNDIHMILGLLFAVVGELKEISYDIRNEKIKVK